jgi:hypothetical protein
MEPQSGRSGNEGLPGDEVIRTPDRRLRVFVSSTLGELADERQAVARAISALRLTPVMFEVGARPHPPQELYRAYLAHASRPDRQADNQICRGGDVGADQQTFATFADPGHGIARHHRLARTRCSRP